MEIKLVNKLDEVPQKTTKDMKDGDFAIVLGRSDAGTNIRGSTNC